MRETTIDPELERELAAIAADQGCELLHVELKGGLLRIFLDRAQGGVSIEDCTAVSRQASALLDVVGFGDRPYTLEVSSPGLDRRLFGPRDFERFTGRRVRVTILGEDGGRQRTVVGRLAAYRAAAAGGEIEVADLPRGEALTIPLERIKSARLEIEL